MRYILYAFHRYTSQRIPYDLVFLGLAPHPAQEYDLELREIDERAYEDLLARSTLIASFGNLEEVIKYAKTVAPNNCGNYPSKKDFEKRSKHQEKPESRTLNVGPYMPPEKSTDKD